MDVAKYETAAIVQELRASQERLGMSRFQVPRDLMPLQGVLLQHNLGTSSTQLTGDRISSGSTQRQYDEMRRALSAWEDNDPRFAPARERAFYGALRNLLMECLSETTEQAQSNRLKAAYRWFIKNSPQQRPDNLGDAAAAATSLSVPRAKTTSYSDHKPITNPNRTNDIQKVTAFEGKSDFYSVYSRDPDGRSSPTNIRPYSPPSPKPVANGLDHEAKAVSPKAQSLPIRPASQADDHPLLRPSLSPTPALSPLPDLAQSPDPTSPTPGTHRPLPFRPASGNPYLLNYQRTKSKNRAGMLQSSGGKLSAYSQLKKEMMGLSEDDEELQSLRARWRMSCSQTDNWSKDIQDTMLRWSVHRARVEEEMSRRQEAARYGAPHSTKYSTTFNVMVEDEPYAKNPFSEDDNMVGKMGAGGTTDSASPTPMYTVSPYTRLRLQAAFPVSPKSARDLQQEDMYTLHRVRDSLDRHNIPFSLVRLRNGLMPAPDKSLEECMAALPRPGDSLRSSPTAKSKSNRGKGGKS
eukprot:CAMPEP_0177760334 /NCGR_PEP_ID=MMETSP0491_2-20121128/5213_1 /TAXON_ID=63592 /ORGANISM="Tetraselmis chuii, Strain PLY429" /LENGTH=521 /DNA_ID=CAMNT_0019276229 /DNA_START=56 /DNA_END=1618 /DNA_ORIENTATION=+